MFLKQVIALTLLIGCFKSVQAQSVSPVVWAPIVQAQPQPAPTIAGYLGSAQNDELVAAQLTFMGHLVLAANLPASVGAPETTLPWLAGRTESQCWSLILSRCGGTNQ
jgi:hypothetical protein